MPRWAASDFRGTGFSLWALACGLALASLAAASDVRLHRDGWFRTAQGELFVPLGGFHANMIPLAWADLSRPEFLGIEPHIWSAQTTAGRGHIDVFDAPDRVLKSFFKRLAKNGVTAVRLFPRARVGRDVLDLCGKLNPELSRAFDKAFAAARPHGIRFLLQILPEPALTSYWYPPARRLFVLPRFSKEDIDGAAPSQRRFLFEGKQVQGAALFTDPDVLACQKRYLGQALDWIERRPEVIALEVYNEQGVAGPMTAHGDSEQAEIEWTAEVVRTIKRRLPAMPVTISHPGSGLTGFDPLRWSTATGVDFYSSHFYAGQCGESAEVDFAAVTAASAAVLRAGVLNFPGEWGVLESKAPEEIRRRAHRDAIWLTLMARSPGFMQWTYEFIEEYRAASKILRMLPGDFSPREPDLAIDIGKEYRRYLLPIFAAYARSLDAGVPVRFAFGSGMTLDEFAALDAARLKRPIRAEGGYQLSYLEDRGFWLGYLRSRAVRAFGDHFLGAPVEAPLALVFDLPEGSYELRLIDLTNGKTRRLRTRAQGTALISDRTSGDYVFLLRRRR